MRARILVALASLLLMLLHTPRATADLPESATLSAAQDMNFNLEGKITSIKGNKLTVNSEENMLFHVLYDDKTQIKKPDGSPGGAKDLRVGIRVAVDGDLAESGEITAKKIDIQPASTEKEKK